MHLSQGLELLRLKLDHYAVSLSELPRLQLFVSPILHLSSCFFQVCTHNFTFFCKLEINLRATELRNCSSAAAICGASSCRSIASSKGLHVDSLCAVEKLGDIKVMHPILLVGTHIMLQVLFQQSIHPLRLLVRLRAKTDGEEQLRPQDFEHLNPKLNSEPRVTVAHHARRDPPKLNDVVDKEV